MVRARSDHSCVARSAVAAASVALVCLLPQITAIVCPFLDLPVVVVQLGFSCILVGAGVWGQRNIVPEIEHRLHPERFAFEAHVQKIIGQLRNATSAGDVSRLLSVGMAEHLCPVSLGIYFRTHNGWKAACAYGGDVAPLLRDTSPLLDAAMRMGRMIKLEELTAKRVESLSERERSLIKALDLALVLPLHRNAGCVGLVFLGRKSSGDVFGASECALLLALTQAASERLAAFKWQAVMAEANRGRDALRRYVPAAVAAELADGRNLDPLEREVSLLFVDIRGYSQFSEGRAVSDVFWTVNRYTQIVSAIVAQYGGSVVEFNGDGMMVLFGAPKPIHNKESCALEAALSIHANMALLGRHAQSPRLSVGIGIATGPAYVGSLRAVDRWIWTALGQATNRASRLQSLTRDLDAAIIIDELTWRRIGARKALFTAYWKSLRGLRNKQWVFVKPLPRTSRRASERPPAETSAIQ